MICRPKLRVSILALENFLQRYGVIYELLDFFFSNERQQLLTAWVRSQNENVLDFTEADMEFLNAFERDFEKKVASYKFLGRYFLNNVHYIWRHTDLSEECQNQFTERCWHIQGLFEKHKRTHTCV